MDSFSLNKTQGADTGNQQVSFTGQKSIIKETGAQKFRFFAPPYDKEKYSVAVEIVPVKFGKDANGQNTEELVAAGKPVLLKNSMSALKYGSYDLDAKDANLPKTDMVGYRFVLIDNNKLRQTRDIEASRDGYLLDSGNAALDGDEKFSYFSKRGAPRAHKHHIPTIATRNNLQGASVYIRLIRTPRIPGSTTEPCGGSVPGKNTSIRIPRRRETA